MYAKLGVLVSAIAISACATSSGRSSAERAVVFGGNTLPRCEFELVQEIAVMVSLQGDAKAAEEALHRKLAESAERRGADGVIGVSIKAPERVPFVVTSGPSPNQAKLPPVEWNAKAQAIRFLDPECRS